MEAVGPVFQTIKCLSDPVVRRIGYVKNLKKTFERLNKLAKELYDKRDDLNLKVNMARPVKIPTFQLQSWFKEVEEIENQINEIEVEYNQKKKCCIGWCPDISSRSKLGKQMLNLINDISVLKERIKSDSEVIVDAPPSAIEKVCTPIIEAGNSAEHTFENLMNCVRSASIRKIGIWGMGGVGKTTIMQKLNNLPEIEQLFDIVIWVTVSRDWNLRKVQDEVARRLSLSLPNDVSDCEVSRRLYYKLENTKYLLLLDDVWDKVNLEEAGIPTTNGSKIVLTTRSLNICNKMETDVEIRVEVLSEEEAWSLFCARVGSVVASPKIEMLARGVVKECGGLPLAVIVVGGALRKEDDVRVWRNALKELSLASTSQIQDMEEVVFKQLKFSYDRLKCDRQKCFLYIALFPEDYEIIVDELIEYWRAAGFIEGAESLAEAVDRGHAILKDLVDASFFEKGRLLFFGRGEYVKVHDVIRDLAIRIASTANGTSDKYLVRARVGLEDPPRDEEWKECNAISLMDNKLRWLPEQLSCPILSTLLLQDNDTLQAYIPGSFFESMTKLRVLDLSRTNIKSLPPSICNLVNLRGLYLCACRDLVELPPEIGALKELEALILAGVNGIRNLPIEVGELTRLKRLHVSFFPEKDLGDEDNKNDDEDKLPPGLKMMIPQGIVSRLSLLEELLIVSTVSLFEDMGIYPKGEYGHPRWGRNLEYVVKDISKLKRLARLNMCFSRVEYLESFVVMSEPWRNGTLTSFCFIVGSSYLPSALGQVDTHFEFHDGVDVPNVVLEVLHRSNFFRLEKHRSIKKLGEFGAENMTHLEVLTCCECVEMETLIDRTCSMPALQELFLNHMPKLRNIWGGEQQGCHLPDNLRVLHLESCPRLPKVLFSYSIIQQLPNLVEIWVRECEGIQEMIGGDDEDVVEYDALPKLKKLNIQCLPNLASISRKALAWSSIEDIEIDDCDNLKSLPLGIHNTSTLKAIRCSRAWWKSLLWEDDAIKNQLQDFTGFAGASSHFDWSTEDEEE